MAIFTEMELIPNAVSCDLRISVSDHGPHFFIRVIHKAVEVQGGVPEFSVDNSAEVR